MALSHVHKYYICHTMIWHMLPSIIYRIDSHMPCIAYKDMAHVAIYYTWYRFPHVMYCIQRYGTGCHLYYIECKEISTKNSFKKYETSCHLPYMAHKDMAQTAIFHIRRQCVKVLSKTKKI